MRWFRSTRIVRFLALLALVCQLVLGFGHVHVDTNSSGLLSIAMAVADVPGADVPAPPSPKPNGLVGDYCAICANIHLAGMALTAAAPMLLPPLSFDHELPWRAVDHGRAADDHFLFDARGPPQA
jgi:hypothetical protein